jgi:uncharacterized membrane protein YdjX (TVP38/TMEM64 family)
LLRRTLIATTWSHLMTDTSTPVAAERWRAWMRIGLFALLVLGVGGALIASGGRVSDALASIRGAVDGAGAWGPVLFIVAYAVLTVLLVPGSPLTIAAGVLFGPFVGTLLVVVGATMGAVGAFLWGRRLGRDAVAALSGERFAKVDDWLGERGLLAVLYLRLVPLVPFNLSNPVAGVTGVSLRDFTIGTGVGIIPGTFAFAALGGSFDDPTSPLFLSALGLLIVLAVAAPIVDRRVRSA